jgi:hypothetical protein
MPLLGRVKYQQLRWVYGSGWMAKGTFLMASFFHAGSAGAKFAALP